MLTVKLFLNIVYHVQLLKSSYKKKKMHRKEFFAAIRLLKGKLRIFENFINIYAR